ncbi:MAG: carboxypeptidase-like regulatory domain-containing protein [Bryobacteraceae bacterium]
MMKFFKISALLAVFLIAAKLNAQSLFATLTGIVSDPTGAVIPGATVTLRDEKSGSVRSTVTDSSGYYTFASVSVGDLTYELSVEAKGFQIEKIPGITLLGGDHSNVNVTMNVGNTNQTITITGSADQIVPVDSGEKSMTLTAKELQNFVQVGSNAAEYIKIAPGFGISNGTSNKAGYSGQTIGINANGDSGSQSPLNGNFSYEGLPSNTLDIVSDGAHVSDPGCNCDTPVNPNTDFISEFKISLFNFNAEDQKGPAVISTVTKSGGSQFHGSGFFSARNYVLNSNDALFNASGQSRPQDKYYYPGGTIGGPVILPWTHFNHNHDKLFFFTGFEYFYQVIDTGLLRATVPTTGELGGDFSAASVAQEGAITATGGPPGQINTSLFPGGIIPASKLDPNMLALAKLYPSANADPNSDGGYNYVQAETFNQNNTQWTSRVDYSISDNTKLFVRYNLQKEVQLFPVGLWWRQTDQVPYPSPLQGRNSSQAITASLTHVFSPSMTNEFVFAYTYIGFPNVFADPSKVDRTNVGYNYSGIFNNGVKQIPSFGGYGWNNSEVPLIFQPGGFEVGGNSAGLYADKWLPSVSDTVTKVWGTHTVKLGFFWEWIRNSQPGNDDTNGYLQFYSGNSTSYGNAVADLVTGNLSGGYVESNFNRVNDISYSTWEGFVQDSWKVNKRLTLNYGLRITDFTPWTDRTGAGYAIFNSAAFSPSCAAAPTYCGFEWHKINPSIPASGFPSSPVFWQPRFGLAYDIFGSGKTVIRGGWGRFYYHSGQFTTGLDTTAGVDTISLSNGNNGTQLFASQLDSLNIKGVASTPSAVDSKDNKEPYSDSYSFTIAQRLPWSSLVEVAYVGNQSHNLPNNSAGAGNDINLVPAGSMLQSNNGGVDPNSLNANNFRPYLGYGELAVATNNLYANYNAFQATFIRTRGRYTISGNYAFGKAMGIVSNTYDYFNLKNDYGVQPGNRKQIFNIAYSVQLPKFTSNRIGGGVINGWQVSGITQIQSGADLTGNASGNFGLTLNSADIPGALSSTGQPIVISNTSLLGTPDIQLNPVLTCNPTSNLGPHQYINPSCFAAPTQVGQNGPTVLPAIYGPAFFNSDLGIFKNFAIKESMKLQFRVDAFNFLNHPLWSFNGTNLTLGFDQSTLKLNTPLFGTTTEKQGNRIVQLAVKFYF